MQTLSDFRQVVSEFMSDFGTEAVIISPSTSGVYDADTSAFTPTAEKRYRVRAIFMDLMKPNNGMGTQPNTLIQYGDKEVYIQPIANSLPLPTIQPNKDLLRIGTDTWSIVTMNELNPTMSSSILIQLYLRK